LQRAAPAGDRTVATTIQTLLRLEKRLTNPYRIAVTGEFNSGKSSLVNLLIGNPVMPTRAVSNTRVPTLIRYAAKPSVLAVYGSGKKLPLSKSGAPDPCGIVRFDVGLPVERLRLIEIADLPGMSDPWLSDRKHDLIELGVGAALWCTIATQAWKESERISWLNVPEAIRNRSVLAATNKDLLKADDEAKVMERLRHMAGALFHEIVMISTPKALSAFDKDLSRKEHADRWRASGAERLEALLGEVLHSLAEQRLETTAAAARRAAERAIQRLGM
jgi:hypothetical protein